MKFEKWTYRKNPFKNIQKNEIASQKISIKRLKNILIFS